MRGTGLLDVGLGPDDGIAFYLRAEGGEDRGLVRGLVGGLAAGACRQSDQGGEHKPCDKERRAAGGHWVMIYNLRFTVIGFKL